MASSSILRRTSGSRTGRPASSRYWKPLPRRRRLMPGPEQSERRRRDTAMERTQGAPTRILLLMPTASDGLNRAQRAAVTHPGGPLVIVAGAGTGKTRTLTRRFAWLVEEGVPPDCILALTFSSPAAA